MLAAKILKPTNVKEALNYVFDITGYAALGITIAILATLIGIAVLIKQKYPDKMKGFTKLAVGVVIGYSLAIITSMGTLGILRSVGRGKKYIANNADWFWGLAKDSKSGMAQLYIYTVIIVIAIALIALLVGKKRKVDKTKSLVYAAVLMALSFALSYVKFLSLPQGGSITFASLVPIMIYSYMFGVRRGVIVGAIYGILQFFQAPYFTHPVQFLLDYPIAFGAIGLTGLFKERNIIKDKAIANFALGALIAVIIRYLSHVVAGAFVFGSADDKYGPIAWSFLYNSFAFADLAIALVAGCGLLASKSFSLALEQVSTNIELSQPSEKVEEKE